MHHADFIRPLGADRLAGEQYLLGEGRADNLNEFLTQPKRNNQPQPSQGHTEPGDFRDHAQITVEGEFTAAGQGIALDHGNGRMAGGFDFSEQLDNTAFRILVALLAGV